nr:hypothetical protein [Tanacetum cinerariifolium]
MSKHCIKPKRKRDDDWFKDKVLLVQAQSNGQILHEEELAFLADPGIVEYVLAEVQNPDNIDYNMINQSVQVMPSSEQSSVAVVKNSNSSTQQDALILSVIEQLKTQFVKNSDLNTQLQEKDFAFTTLKNELRKLNGKNIINTVVSNPNATITPGMFKLDIEPISARLKNNRDAHEELLVYASQTCPNSPKPSENLVVVTPVNKDKRVRFAEPVTSSNNIPKQTDSFKTKDSNKPLLTSTRVKPTTSASGSKPLGNTKNNRITRPPRSNKKNKEED